MRKILLLLMFLPLGLFAQERELLNFSLKARIAQSEPSELIPVYLHGDVERIEPYLREIGAKLKGKVGSTLSVAIPAAAFQDLSAKPFIQHVEYEESPPEMLSDVVLINNNVLPIHQGAGSLPEAYQGQDVVMGFIDSGIELEHPDFQHEDGSTRIIALWDQTQAENDPQRIPEPYGYGQEYTAEDIDAGISNHGDQPQFFGHGSTVTGVAVGNANASGDFLGVAPKADIIVVSSDFTKANWKSTVAEAAEYIFERAAAIGKPAVVNASLGTYLGSHDGLDAPALYIDSLLDAMPGRVMVCAAGNSNAWDPYHLGYTIPENDTAFTWFEFNSNALENGAVFLEAWGDVADWQNMQFTIGADLSVPNLAFRGYAAWRNPAANVDIVITDTLWYQGMQLGVVQTWVGQRGDQYQLQAVLTQPFSSQYRWRFATTGGGRIDVWSRAQFGLSNMLSQNLPGPGSYAPMLKYRMPDKKSTMVDSWACSEKVITVANYMNQTEFLNYSGEMTTYDGEAGQLSPNSSSGPTRDQRQKPDVASTGDVVLSAGRLSDINFMISNGSPNLAFSGWHYVNGGTSMASPVVAGAAALYLERCSQADYSDFKDALIATAIADEFTGALPGDRFGHGKLDAYSLLLTSVEPISLQVPEPICEGQALTLSVSGSYTDVQWSDGQQGNSIAVNMPDTYQVQASDMRQCLQKSPEVWVDFLEAPDVPLLTFDEVQNLLIASGVADTWQWYLDDVAIQGANEPTLQVMDEGAYTAEAIAANGCSSFSEPFLIGIASLDEESEPGDFSLFPNPASGSLFVQSTVSAQGYSIYDLSGKTVMRQSLPMAAGERHSISLPSLAPGVYLFSLEGSSQNWQRKLLVK